MKCNICQTAIEKFHMFPKKALFNKPLKAEIPSAKVDMNLGYCGTCRHISSIYEGGAMTQDLEKQIYEDLYDSFTPTTFSPFQHRYTDFVGDWLNSWLKPKSRIL